MQTDQEDTPHVPEQQDPHCPTLAIRDLVSTSSRDVGGFPFTDPQHPSINVATTMTIQLHAWNISDIHSAAEAFQSTLPHKPLDHSESLLWQCTSQVEDILYLEHHTTG